MKISYKFAQVVLKTTVGASLVAMSMAVSASDTISIGVPVGLSGANSVVAPSVVQSSQLAVEEINAAGGILGKKVSLEIADDGSGAAGLLIVFGVMKIINFAHGAFLTVGAIPA